MNSNWGYIETAFFAFILSLCNSIPFFWRVYKKKTTESFSSWTLLMSTLTGFISIIKYPASFYYEITGSNSSGATIETLRWIPDILANFISFLTIVFVLVMKIKNAKADPSKENMKFNFKNNKIIPMIIFISLAIIALSITIYFKVVQRMNTSMALWLYILFSIGACISAVSAIPFTIKLVVTRNTYSISLFSKISLFLAMIVWTILDIQTSKKIAEFLPALVADAFIMLWTLIPIIYKFTNLIIAKKHNLSEKEYCESLQKAKNNI
ncbi:MAG: hypothetical protein LBV48_00300 [Mycoplasmataceae bacterium]|nr:hypothetical protein [Mycoplasmataceae bacterium]